jgi:hypothetical protein
MKARAAAMGSLRRPDVYEPASNAEDLSWDNRFRKAI